ncbi:DMT family transporter [Candidatus Peregrinibacteria bacterium]|nr:DMT family transporter [Candidatus Peregrinibacteria bacterium]
MWLLFAILAPFCWGFANPIDAALRRNWFKDDLVLMSVFALTKLPVAVCFLVLFGQGIVFGWPFFWIFLSGIIWMLAFVFFYHSLQIEEVSRVVLILQFQPVLIFLIAVALIHESLNFSQFMAFSLIFIGSILAAFKKTKSRWHFSKVFLFIILAGFMWSLADVIFKKYVIYFPNFWAAFGVDLLGSSLLGGLLFFLPKYRSLYGGFKLSKIGWTLVFLSAVFGILGSLFFAYALTLGKASLTTVVIGLQPLFAMFFGLMLSYFIKEISRESMNKSGLIVKFLSFVLILAGLVYLYL